MNETHVFPQDVWDSEEQGYVRHGGLKKRELFAAMIYAAAFASGMSELKVANAVDEADMLLKELKK